MNPAAAWLRGDRLRLPPRPGPPGTAAGDRYRHPQGLDTLRMLVEADAPWWRGRRSSPPSGATASSRVGAVAERLHLVQGAGGGTRGGLHRHGAPARLSAGGAGRATGGAGRAVGCPGMRDSLRAEATAPATGLARHRPPLVWGGVSRWSWRPGVSIWLRNSRRHRRRPTRYASTAGRAAVPRARPADERRPLGPPWPTR